MITIKVKGLGLGPVISLPGHRSLTPRHRSRVNVACQLYKCYILYTPWLVGTICILIHNPNFVQVVQETEKQVQGWQPGNTRLPGSVLVAVAAALRIQMTSPAVPAPGQAPAPVLTLNQVETS